MDKKELLELGLKFRGGAFPGETWESLNNKYKRPFPSGEAYRSFVRRELKKENKLSNDKVENNVNKNYTLDINKDGSQTSTKLIEMSEEQAKDSNYLLEKHGYSKLEFELISAKNSIWNSGKNVLYSSKITVKPRTEYIWNQEDIEKIFYNLKTEYKKKIPVFPNNYEKNGNVLLISLADLHYGLVAEPYSTNNAYNLDIAEEIFYYTINNIIERIKGKKFEKILFLLGHDAVNCDNINGTTTSGTPQDNCSSWFDTINRATQLFINGIDMLAEIAPVNVQYIVSNHDLHSMFGIMQTINAWYKDDENVEIDTSPLPRKYYKVGKNLLCFSHDIKIKDALRIVTTEAKDMWSECDHMICILGHLHQGMIYEKQGYLEVMRLPTLSGYSRWSLEKGYIQTEKRNQTFIINDELGITDVINTIIK